MYVKRGWLKVNSKRDGTGTADSPRPPLLASTTDVARSISST